MLRAITTLVAVVAIAAPSAPAWSLAEVAQSTAKQKPRRVPKSKAQRPAPRGARKKPPIAETSPVVSPPPESAPEPSESDVLKLARVRAQRQAVEREIQKLRRQTVSTLQELDSIDLNLRLAAHQFDEAELTFKETRRSLDATIRDVKVTRDQLESTRPRVEKSLGALSKLGELSYARLLFSLDDPADILRGYRYVSRIATADSEQIKNFRKSLVRLNGLEEQLKQRTALNIETRTHLTQARAALANRKASRELRLEEISREQDLHVKVAEEFQKREAELRSLLGEVEETAPESSAPKVRNVAPFQAVLHLQALKGELPWPVRGTLVRKFGMERDSKFGTRTIQQGIEIDAFPENAVRAVHAGRVVYADQFIGYGMLVIVDHGQREHTLYGRLGELKVSPGDDVAAGALLGLLPNTRVTGSGLHFEVRIESKPEDPLDWLKKP